MKNKKGEKVKFKDIDGKEKEMEVVEEGENYTV
jgi:hypothetical protein